MILENLKKLQTKTKKVYSDKFDTLFTRIFVRFMLLSLIIILVLGFAMIYFFYEFHFSNTENEIVNNTQVFNSTLFDALQEGDTEEVEQTLGKIAEVNSGQAWLIDEEGFLIYAYPFLDAEESRVQFLNAAPIFNGNVISQEVEPRYFDRPMLLIGLPVRQQQEIAAGILVFTSVAGINSTIAQVRRLMIYSSLLAIILGMILAYGWSRSLASPLKNMSEAVMDLSDGDYGLTIDLLDTETTREMSRLQKSFNVLSQELDSKIAELRRERNKLKHILTGMQEGVLVVNSDKKIVLFNNSASKLLDLEDDLEGRDYTEVLFIEEVEETLNEVIENPETASKEFTIEKECREIRILFRVTPIMVRGNFWGVVGLLQDISERWRFEKLQKDFVANVSHELKAPLSSIKGSVEILLDGIVEDREKKEEYLNIVLQESDRLAELVDEILNMAEYENKNFAFEKAEISVNGLLHDMDSIFERSISIDNEEEKVRVEYLPEDVKITANESRIKQVIYNFLDNAMKFSPEESPIVLGAEINNEEPDEVCIFVEDKGIGIPVKEQENIWERFYKVDKARTPGQEGSGLGLAISKKIIAEHEGEVFVNSEPGEGSVFGFCLPISK